MAEYKYVVSQKKVTIGNNEFYEKYHINADHVEITDGIAVFKDYYGNTVAAFKEFNYIKLIEKW